jgi:hypothetical protein
VPPLADVKLYNVVAVAFVVCTFALVMVTAPPATALGANANVPVPSDVVPLFGDSVRFPLDVAMLGVVTDENVPPAPTMFALPSRCTIVLAVADAEYARVAAAAPDVIVTMDGPVTPLKFCPVPPSVVDSVDAVVRPPEPFVITTLLGVDPASALTGILVKPAPDPVYEVAEWAPPVTTLTVDIRV